MTQPTASDYMFKKIIEYLIFDKEDHDRLIQLWERYLERRGLENNDVMGLDYRGGKK